ncbi:MAG: OmpA family protein [Thiomicrospira sp.]|jgi:OOP family OmpA-OmpF porin|nr:OmpA family protein [Thiomicrospira sp.]
MKRIWMVMPLFTLAVPSWANPQTDSARPAIDIIEHKSNAPSHIREVYRDLDEDSVVTRFDQCQNSALGLPTNLIGCELDSDGDGVYDHNDQCPQTPTGRKVNFLGCQADADQDGVLDEADRCPGTPLGTLVDAEGCKAISDSDGDGIIDSLDLCADTAPGLVVNAQGCEPRSQVITHIVFNTGSYEIRVDQKPILDRDAAQLRRMMANEVLLITGHTDDVGSAQSNEKLSWHRAFSTKAYLADTFNLPAAQIYILGKGESEPVADNLSAEGRQQNRRIHFDIVPSSKIPSDAALVIPQAMHGYQRFITR